MDDIAESFTEPFLEAIGTLEEYVGSDQTLRLSLQEIKAQVEKKGYTSAPSFWDDLQTAFKEILATRTEIAAKTKAKQMLKHVARLEVKFWAKESVSMLKELDAEFRLERIVDWIDTFETGEGTDASSGPAVLYQVLMDVELQRDMEVKLLDTLRQKVVENIGKFPVEMQPALERVGMQTETGGRGLSDWRRKQQPGKLTGAAAIAAQIESRKVDGVNTPLPGVMTPMPGIDTPLPVGMLTPLPGIGTPFAGANTPMPGARTPVPGARTPVPGVRTPIPGVRTPIPGVVTPLPAAQAENYDGEPIEPVEQDGGDAGVEEAEGFNLENVDQAKLATAKRSALAMLESNSGECPKHFIRRLLQQAGLSGMPIAMLGEEIFHPGQYVYLRREAAQNPAVTPSSGLAVDDELRAQLVELVRSAEGQRLQFSTLVEQLQWQGGSLRQAMHGPLKKAFSQVPEVFYEPNKVFLVPVARHYVTSLGEPEVAQVAETQSNVVVDPFAELIALILSWLQQGGGVLHTDHVLPLIKVMSFKPKAVIAAMQANVFWSHPEAECEILVRTTAGAAQHPKPLPDVYLNKHTHQQILREVRAMGANARMDKLAGKMRWNAKSELKKAYGNLRHVLIGFRDLFYDPSHLYLKQSLNGIVDWPVSADGRVGPQDIIRMKGWTKEADDFKNVDPEVAALRRLVLGTIMRCGGSCKIEEIRKLLSSQHLELTFEGIMEPGSRYDVSSAIFWKPDRIFHLKPEVAAKRTEMENKGSPELKRIILDAVQTKGSATLQECLKLFEEAKVAGSLEDVAELSEKDVAKIAVSIPELLFEPDQLYLKPLADLMLEFTPAKPGAVDTSASQDASGNPADSDSKNFFSFDGSLEEQVQAQKGLNDELMEEETEDQVAVDGQPAKRQKVESTEVEGWAQDVPAWFVEGAAVKVRAEYQQGEIAGLGDLVAVILKVSRLRCTIRLTGRGGAVIKEFSVSALLPAAPTIGCNIQVIGGDRRGCFGILVGLAGQEGVVQIGKMSYETLPMSDLVVMG